MSIYPDYFSVYERPRSGKWNSFVSQINSHVHDSIFGDKITFTNLAGYLVAVQVQDGLINGSMISASSITSSHIVDATIVMDDISPSSFHFEPNTGYAYYKP